jgi:DNA-binding transcriptional ArsR family regulator
MAISPRQVTGDAKRWKAMSHPLRRDMLRHLGEHGPATSTTLAEALGENTGSTSYHLRILADAGVIEEVPDQTNGRERWWRTFPTDLREPDYDSLSSDDRAALDEWRATQIPGELDLLHRFIRDVRKHGAWARSSRAAGYYTTEDLDALFGEYLALLSKYGHTAEEAPPGARPMQLRMFYLPEEPAEPPRPGG